MIRKLKNTIHKINSWIWTVLYGWPARDLKLITVTGTDGKTTSSWMIYHILSNLGVKASLVSSIGVIIDGQAADTGLHTTTPSPREFQKILRRVANSTSEYLILEMTAHGIDQDRLVGYSSEIALFTNVTNEHLDYFGNYDKYLEVKARLMDHCQGSILINPKSVGGEQLLSQAQQKGKESQVKQFTSDMINFQLSDDFISRFPGDYNKSNLAGAITACESLGYDRDQIVNVVEKIPVTPGRFQKLDLDLPVNVVVDFAHTPQALKEVLSAGIYGNGKKIAVFGAASERDSSKRAPMGEISCELADFTVLTAEDPRFEKVEDINEEILVGCKKSGGVLGENVFSIPDRHEAIKYAMTELAGSGDWVIVCGKGHEKSMNFDGVEYPWSDEAAVLDIINEIK